MASNDQNDPSAAIPTWNAGGLPLRIFTNGDHLVKTGPGAILSICVNTVGSDSGMTIYDGIDATGTLIATVSTLGQVVLPIAARFTVGLFIVSTGSVAADTTVIYL